MAHDWVITLEVLEAFFALVGVAAGSVFLFNVHRHRWERIATWEDRVFVNTAMAHRSATRIKARCAICGKQRVFTLEQWPYLRLAGLSADELEQVMRSSK